MHPVPWAFKGRLGQEGVKVVHPVVHIEIEHDPFLCDAVHHDAWHLCCALWWSPEVRCAAVHVAKPGRKTLNAMAGEGLSQGGLQETY